MHEGGHGILHNHGTQDQHTSRKVLSKFAVPAILLLLIILSAVQNWSIIQAHLLSSSELPTVQEESLRRWFEFDLAVIPMLLGGALITYTTLVSIIEKRQITAGLLVVIALFASALTEEYLAGAIAAFIMISGEFLEDLTLAKTRSAVKALIELVPETAWLFQDKEWVQIPLHQVKPLDLILVKSGERVPVDGEIVSGRAAIDESTLTGESMPVDKTVSNMVFAGTINQDGAVEVKVSKTGHHTAIGRIIDVVYQAQENKGQTQQVADKF
ncbi:MAG: HAD-IC family P-type ATPase, partial [Candidatus Poribacteria bacterium]|nr:HAD-IC family P-type ATPase [Candidatus Poribacteria bacterium]